MISSVPKSTNEYAERTDDMPSIPRVLFEVTREAMASVKNSKETKHILATSALVGFYITAGLVGEALAKLKK